LTIMVTRRVPRMRSVNSALPAYLLETERFSDSQH